MRIYFQNRSPRLLMNNFAVLVPTYSKIQKQRNPLFCGFLITIEWQSYRFFDQRTDLCIVAHAHRSEMCKTQYPNCAHSSSSWRRSGFYLVEVVLLAFCLEYLNLSPSIFGRFAEVRKTNRRGFLLLSYRVLYLDAREPRRETECQTVP